MPGDQWEMTMPPEMMIGPHGPGQGAIPKPGPAQAAPANPGPMQQSMLPPDSALPNYYGNQQNNYALPKDSAAPKSQDPFDLDHPLWGTLPKNETDTSRGTAPPVGFQMLPPDSALPMVPMTAMMPQVIPQITAVVPMNAQMAIPTVPVVNSVLPREEIVLAPGVQLPPPITSIPRMVSGTLPTLHTDPHNELWNAEVQPNFNPLFDDKLPSDIFPIAPKSMALPMQHLYPPVKSLERSMSGLPEFRMDTWIDGPIPQKQTPRGPAQQPQQRGRSMERGLRVVNVSPVGSPQPGGRALLATPSVSRSPSRGRSQSLGRPSRAASVESLSTGKALLVSRSPSRGRDSTTISTSARSISPYRSVSPRHEPVVSKDGKWTPVVLEERLESMRRSESARDISPARRQPEVPLNGRWDPIVRKEGAPTYQGISQYNPSGIQRGRSGPQHVHVESLGYTRGRIQDLVSHGTGVAGHTATRELDATGAAGKSGNILTRTSSVDRTMQRSASSVSRQHSTDHRTTSSGGPTKLNVWIIAARGLKSSDIFGKDDPYVICQLDQKTKEKRFQTKVLNNAGSDPQWHHGPEALPYSNEPELEFLICDKDLISSDFLGKAVLPRDRFLHGGYEGELSLRSKDGKTAVPGSLRVKVQPVGAGVGSGTPRTQSVTRHSLADHRTTSPSYVPSTTSVVRHHDYDRSISVPRSGITTSNYVPSTISGITGGIPRDRSISVPRSGITSSNYIPSTSSVIRPDRSISVPRGSIGNSSLPSSHSVVRPYSGPTVTPSSPGRQSSPEHRTTTSSAPSKINVWVFSAKAIKGTDWWGKADPYCVCRLDEKTKEKSFQTKVMNDAGSDPVWNHGPEALPYNNEPQIEFLVYDKDNFSSKFLGKAVLPKDRFLRGYEGELQLKEEHGQKDMPGRVKIRVQPVGGGGTSSSHSTTSITQHSGSVNVPGDRIRRADGTYSNPYHSLSTPTVSNSIRPVQSGTVPSYERDTRTELDGRKIVSSTEYRPSNSDPYSTSLSTQPRGYTNPSYVSRDSRTMPGTDIQVSRTVRPPSPGTELATRSFFVPSSGAKTVQPFASGQVSSMPPPSGVLDSSRAAGTSGALLSQSSSSVRQPLGGYTQDSLIQTIQPGSVGTQDQSVTQYRPIDGTSSIPSTSSALPNPSTSSVIRQPSTEQRTVSSGAPMKSTAASGSSKCLELVFDAPYDSIDKHKFKEELFGIFRALGMPDASLNQLEIELLPGSVIARVQGPPWAITELRSKNLVSIKVMGYTVKMTREVPVQSTTSLAPATTTASVFDTGSTIRAGVFDTTSSSVARPFESVPPTSAAYASQPFAPPQSYGIEQQRSVYDSIAPQSSQVRDKAPERKTQEQPKESLVHQSAEDLKKMPISKLKSLLTAMGVRHDDCVEKMDLVNRVLQAQGEAVEKAPEPEAQSPARDKRRSTLGSSWISSMEEEATHLMDGAKHLVEGFTHHSSSPGGSGASPTSAVSSPVKHPEDPAARDSPRRPRSGNYEATSNQASQELAEQTKKDCANPALVDFDTGLVPPGLNSQAIGCVQAGQKLSDAKPVLVRFDTPLKQVFTEKAKGTDSEWLERFQVGDIKLGVISSKGSKGSYDPTPNQDNFSVTRMHNGIIIYMVCDGHGPFGHIASFRVCQALPYFMVEALESGVEPEVAFKNSFEMAQLDLLEHGDRHDVDFSSSGSTATVVLQMGDEVLLGWLGDSRALLVSSDPQPQSEIWTAAHNPTDPEEQRRLLANGAELRTDEGGSSKRIYAPGKNYPGLAVSRAFGDFAVMNHGVTTEPDMLPLVLGRDAGTLIVASDGVWEFMDDKKTIDVLYKDNRLEKKGPQKAVEQVSKVAKGRWEHHEGEYCDDITCLVLTWGGRPGG